jgi:hypothetical protein
MHLRCVVLRRPPPLPITLLALSATGCGLLVHGKDDPASVQQRFEEERSRPPDPPSAYVFQGEIRDFATLRLEPTAMLEFWSDASSYTPEAELDGGGRFSVFVETCLNGPAPVSLGEALFLAVGDAIFFPPSWHLEQATCGRWISHFGIRARAEDRPVVLWLRDCREPLRGGRAWRPMPVSGGMRRAAARVHVTRETGG